jgi:hypothetical protein
VKEVRVPGMGREGKVIDERQEEYLLPDGVPEG